MHCVASKIYKKLKITPVKEKLNKDRVDTPKKLLRGLR